MARGKYKEEFAQYVYDMIVEKNFNDKQCIEELNISKKTFYEWLQESHKNYKSDFSTSYKKAKEIQSKVYIEFLKEQSNKHITGYFVEEIDTYIKRDENGKEYKYIKKRKRWIKGDGGVLIHDKKVVDPIRWNEQYQVKLMELEKTNNNKQMIDIYKKLIINSTGFHHRHLLTSEYQFIGLIGGSGSGKTHDLVRYFTYQLLKDERNNLLVFRHYSNSIINSIFNEYLSFMNDLGVVRKSNTTNKLITINFGENRRDQLIKFVGVDNEQALESVKGLTTDDDTDFNLAHIEELSEFDENVFNLIPTRLRSVGNVKLIFGFTSNPVRGNSWIKNNLIDKESEYYICRSTYKNNGALSQDYVNYIESLQFKNEKLYKQYALGEFVSLGTEIFPEGTYTKVNSIDESWTLQGYGLDIGYVNGKTALIGAYSRPNQGEDKHVKPFEWLAQELFYAPVQTANDVVSIIDNLNIRKDLPLYIDSANIDVARILQNEGYYCMPATKGAGSIKRGIQEIQYLKPYLHGENLIREFESFEYEVDKNGYTIERPSPDCQDHLIDAFRYFEQGYNRIQKR